jgi:hypothetical protein
VEKERRMYRFNEVGRPVLITVDEVISKAAVDQNADIRYILNSIEVAEERYIAPALGDNLYNEIVAMKNVTVTSGNRDSLVDLINASRTAAGKNAITTGDLMPGAVVNAIELCSEEVKELWNRYLWKVTAEAVDILAIVPTWLRHTAQGQQLNAPQTIGGITEGSASGDRKDVQFKIDAMAQSRLLPLIDRMKKYLCDHADWFPLYEDCGCNKEVGINNRIGGIIMGVYDDDKTERHYVAPVTTPRPAARLQGCSMRIQVVETPDSSLQFMLCNLSTIPKQYTAGDDGATLTVAHLAGKDIQWPVYIGNDAYADMPYDKVLGKLGSVAYGVMFTNPSNVLINYIETM